MKNVNKEELEKIKERILKEAEEYTKSFPEDVYLENFYSDSWVDFLDKYNLELIYWIENGEVHISEI